MKKIVKGLNELAENLEKSAGEIAENDTKKIQECLTAAYKNIDKALFYNGNNIDDLIYPIMREHDITQAEARIIVYEWAEKRGYVIEQTERVVFP